MSSVSLSIYIYMSLVSVNSCCVGRRSTLGSVVVSYVRDSTLIRTYKLMPL
jgi:hypothetical protein